ncbi:MAG: class I SAM-dependent methyltransferase [Leptospiraceae bacterium]|nr:class I SAM-dependent methyltransferase [Leptospiraceae bacterium]MCP5499571.1 class I SAM-dependent methyltransferase [Leptospiraceae bacterium]
MLEENRFDKLAESWDESPMRRLLSSSAAKAIREIVPLHPEMKALDYGCGTGLVLLHLHGDLKEVVGMDLSKGMIEVLQKKVKEAGILNVRAETHNMDTDPLPLNTFDLMFSSMALHHIHKPEVYFQKAFLSLKSGGYLCTGDLEEEDGSFHPEDADYHHQGFSLDYIRNIMEDVGFKDIQIQISCKVEKNDKIYPVFMAVGKKP